MAEHEFERFLAVLSKLLKLSSAETAAVADEICDHLEERYCELVRMGVSRDDAVKQALDEFDDAGEFAGKLNQLVRQRTRRRIMTGALTTAAASALAILVTTAFWPDQRPAGPATSAAAKDAAKKPAEEADDGMVFIDDARFLPESLRKPVEVDLHDVELGAFGKFVQEQTGIPVVMDATELSNAGVGLDTEMTFQTFQLPLYLAMDRLFENVGGAELAWMLDDGVITIMTKDKADTIKEAQTVDVSELLDGGFTMPQIINVLEQHTTGPWENIDGDGGRLIPLGTRLTFLQTQRERFEVLSILEGLKTPGRRILIDQPEAHRKIRQGLAARVSGDFKGVTLADAMKDFASQADIPIALDAIQLADYGVSTDVEVSLSLPAGNLQRALKILLKDVGGVELAAVPSKGVLLITTREKADTMQDVEIFDVSDLVTQEEMRQVYSLIETGTSGAWRNVDGDGGTITVMPKQRVIVRQSRAGLDSVNRLLNEHRKTVRARPPRAEPDPKQVELRYYRMTEKLAHELRDILPRLVAVDSWAKLPDGTTPLIETISVGNEAPTGFGNRGGRFGASGQGMGGMGGGGGGFFQIGGVGGQQGDVEGEGSSGTTAPAAGHTPNAASPTAILAIRHTRRVHQEIDKFLRDLAEKAWPNSYGPSAPSINSGGMGSMGGGIGGGGLGGGGNAAQN